MDNKGNYSRNSTSIMENAVALKLPSFWSAQPRVWFQLAEAQFALRNVAIDSTKYYHVVAALDQDTAKRLIDLLESPPQEEKYSAIKQRLLGTFDLSPQERASRLLDLPDLGDRKPSELMDDMLALLGSHEACFIFQCLFLRRMPEDVRVILAGEELTDPRRLAQRADALWLAGSGRTGATVSRVASSSPSRSHGNNSHNVNDRGLCFFHRRFGEKARKCVFPCKYQGNGQAGR